MKTKKGHLFSAKLMSVAAIAFMLFVASCEKDDPTPEPQATCDDGIQNGDETGIDCGGSCTACVTMAAPNLNVRSRLTWKKTVWVLIFLLIMKITADLTLAVDLGECFGFS